jgi:hypothetical protein
MTSYPTYTFTYAAIADEVENTILYGGKYGYITYGNVLPPGTIGDTGTVVTDEIVRITDKMSEIISFLQDGYTSTTYNGGANLTINPIQTVNKYYVLNIPTPTVGAPEYTITFDDDGFGDGALFYIYNTDNLVLANIKFALSGAANPNNIYVLCDMDINFYSSLEYYGNFITTLGFFMFSGCKPTLYGTASALTSNSVVAAAIVGPSIPLISIYYTTPCFMHGTKILTDNWYVPVEDLRVGDLVMTHGAIIENGHIVGDDIPMQVRNISKNSRKAISSTSPISITKNAFGPNKPFEDLYVSPNHGLLNSKGRLYPAKKFINETSIFQNPTIDFITYYHIELDGHFAITANGVITESYRNPRGQAPPSRSAKGVPAPPPQTPPPSTTSPATAPRS